MFGLTQLFVAIAAAVAPVPRLPAAITIERGPIASRIARDGHVRRLRQVPQPYPRRAVWFPGTGTWYMLRRGHLLVGRRQRPEWRSHGAITSLSSLGVVTATSSAVAYQHDHKLFLASVGGAEHAVARRELPLGWAGRGLYAYRYQGRDLILRSDTGRLLSVIAHQPLGSDYYVSGGSVYFIEGGMLMRADGARVVRLASLHRLGLSASSNLQPAGRMVELQDDHRLVVLRSDGSLFARGGRTGCSTAAPKGSSR